MASATPPASPGSRRVGRPRRTASGFAIEVSRRRSPTRHPSVRPRVSANAGLPLATPDATNMRHIAAITERGG
jgi:hypothetical protein